MTIDIDIVVHNARVFGLHARHEINTDKIVIDSNVGKVTVQLLHNSSSFPLANISLLPCEHFIATAGKGQFWAELRSFSRANEIVGAELIPVVTDASGLAVWAFMPNADGGRLLIGTNLASDLTVLRQGDPAAAANRPTEPQWGIAGERPTYLFEGQLDTDKPHDRMADWWMWTMRDALIRHAGVKADDILPFGAKGVVIVTGDDDQAPLEDYRAQEKLLGGLPVTYFLHPLTNHTRQTIAEHSMGRSVEWEIHPDALETPRDYDARFDEQAAWFEGLKGQPPRLVRNHGFLNDGYWGHAKAWKKHGITGSSNLPGLDCRVLNGSLLPARLALDGQLTDHWSILTAFGDGVMFALEWDEKTVAKAIEDAGKRIIESGVPGILVFNLHPANHEKAACMHAAVRKLVENGFAAMTFGAALEWFKARDAGHVATVNVGMLGPFTLPKVKTVSAPVQDESPPALPLKMGTRLRNVARWIIGTGAHN